MNRPRGTTAATAAAVVLSTAGTLLAAAAPASAAVTCASPVFKRTFYANTTFTGTPRGTDCDSLIDQNWGTGAAGYKGMPADNFGVRWSTTRDFGSGGPFTFTAATRDGIRVYVDGVRKVDVWKNVSATVSRTVNLTIPKGTHSLRIDFVNWTGAANVRFAYTPRTSASVDKVKPLVPSGATVAHDAASTSTKVGWARNKEMDLAGYRVYRRLKGAAYPAQPLATTTSASYTDTTVPKDGNVYYYEVRAYDKAGNASSGTTDLAVTTVDRVAPAAPKGVEDNWAMGSPTEITLHWDGNTEPDLAEYRVYRSTSRPVALTASNRLASSGGGYRGPLPQTGDLYYYVVTAVDTHGNESAPSGTAMYYSDDLTGPVDTALNARASESEAGVTVAWDASERTSADFAGYSVFRTSRPGTANARRTEVAAHVRGTSFTDAAPPPGVTYAYRVVALDHEGNGGTPSEELTLTVVGNTTAPAAVTGVTAVPGGTASPSPGTAARVPESRTTSCCAVRWRTDGGPTPRCRTPRTSSRGRSRRRRSTTPFPRTASRSGTAWSPWTSTGTSWPPAPEAPPPSTSPSLTCARPPRPRRGRPSPTWVPTRTPGSPGRSAVPRTSPTSPVSPSGAGTRRPGSSTWCARSPGTPSPRGTGRTLPRRGRARSTTACRSSTRTAPSRARARPPS
ncbi:PA14 domain-containing protein [[Kitasatospora] papulosa]|uniref:fibronectin type III domain-containing protein n=1 Tax=[Kitasatospora] papulosa TaxID=1464011 RepID=UPI0037FF5178